MKDDLFGHPRGLAVIFLIEMWERFSYYGMRAILILYLVNHVGWPVGRAANLYGTFTALAYATPLAGGWLADRLLGARRSVAIGGVLIAAGHFALAFGGMTTFYLGLTLVVAGTGFFKPNSSTLVGQLYRLDDPRRDAGYTLFYVSINISAFLAPLVCGYLGERVGWHAGFAAAGVGMTAGLLIYLWGQRYLTGIGLAPRDPAAARPAPAADDWRRVAALAIVAGFVVLFWTGFEQQGSSLNLFADRHTDRMVGGFLIPASWFQTINGLCILLLAPLFAILWTRLGRAGREPPAPVKMAIGLLLLAAGFAVMAAGGRLSDAGATVSPLWLVATYLLNTCAELCISPVGISYASTIAPARWASLLMAAWFLANGIGNKLAGSLAAISDRMPAGAYFSIFVVSSLAGAALLALLAPLIGRLTASPLSSRAPRGISPA